MCCFAKEVLASACVSRFRSEEEATETQRNPPCSCPEEWITARKDDSVALEKEEVFA